MGAVRAVLFDLDDTLFPHDAWTEGIWAALGDAATGHGVDTASLLRTLRAAAASEADGIEAIEHALECADAEGISVAPLLEVLHQFRSPALSPYPWVPHALARLRREVPLGLVTDGDPRVQRGKLDSLGLVDAFDVVVYCDELGREFRTPNPMPFRLALSRLGVGPEDAVFVGDRPDRDVAGALAAGMRAIRVRTGAHEFARDLPGTWRTLPDVLSAIDVLCRATRARGAAAAASRAMIGVGGRATGDGGESEPGSAAA